MEDVFDRPDYPRFQSREEFQISPVLKNTLFRSETDDIPYETWDSIDRCSPVHIEGLHRLRIVSRTILIPFDTLRSFVCYLFHADSEVLESEITDPHISTILTCPYHTIHHKSIADKSIFNVGNPPTQYC